MRVCAPSRGTARSPAAPDAPGATPCAGPRSAGRSACSRHGHDIAVDAHEAVARERGDRLRVIGAFPGEDRAQRVRAPLTERAVERRLLAQGLVRATA